MNYDPKEVEKWDKIKNSKNPLLYMKKLLKTGKLNRGDIPVIKGCIRALRADKKSIAEKGELGEQAIRELEKIILSLEEDRYGK